MSLRPGDAAAAPTKPTSAARLDAVLRAGQAEAEYADQRSLQISQLFVAMTRARDGLFVVCDGEPSQVVADAIEQFELVET